MRIRSIKPEFWRSQDIASLRRDVRLLFIGLWSYVDDNGVGIDDYRQVAADLFALEDDPIAAREFTREGLATLCAAGLVARYTCAGKAYLYITGWHHQRVDRPSKPRYPTPSDCEVTCTNTTTDSALATPSRDSRDTLAPGTEEQGNRGTGEQGSTDSSSPSACADAHEDGRDSIDPEILTEEAPQDASRGPSRSTADAPEAGELKAGPRGPSRSTAGKPRGPSRSTAGERLPDPFPVTAEMAAWAREHTPTCGIEDHESFVDYWRGKPGAAGKKLDWPATWRNWMRTEHRKRAGGVGRGQSTNGNRPSTTDQRVAEGLALADRLDAQYATTKELTV